jgi:hypothetical protein
LSSGFQLHYSGEDVADLAAVEALLLGEESLSERFTRAVEEAEASVG